MSTKIFVVCLGSVWGAGEQAGEGYNWHRQREGRSVTREHGEERRVGLARALSKLGFCSRAKGFELVHAGRVRLNGITPKNPETPVRPGRDRIEVDGATVTAAGRIYWMLNKPRGAVTTAEDERGRETVYARLPEGLPWMGSVGRLDKASEGLLIFTNDSEWAARITAPESHVDKTYQVQIGALVEESLLRALLSGVTSEDGLVMRARQAKRIREGEKNSWIEVVLDEGQNRQIRRMLEACGVKVLRLVRVAIGALELGLLVGKGEARELTEQRRKSSTARELERIAYRKIQRSSTGNP